MKKCAVFFFAIYIVITAIDSVNADKKAEVIIESVRKDGLVTVMCDQMFKPGSMKLYNENKEIVCTFLAPLNGNGTRFLARFEGKAFSVRAGMILAMKPVTVSSIKLTPEKKPEEKSIFKKSIISKIDKRAMVFIDAGFFYVGSDNGEDDEKPRHVCFLDGYYMDSHEVSNRDYLEYVKVSHGKFPRSWGGIEIGQSAYDLPVLVSYTEAERYALWAGKSLPTEEEWEKGASVSNVKVPVYGKDGYSEVHKQTLYPWGDKYVPDASICNDYWTTASGISVLKKSNIAGPQPVHREKPDGVSDLGLIDVSGNLPEWTSSWYQPYEGNTMTHFRFGKQVKVIKGGGWYSSRESLRVSSREYGGIPNLEEDSIASFRCIKRPNSEDLE